MIHTKFQAPAIDIKHVYYLMMLDQLGSISKAANALGVAQPSLSENITRLEKKLNTRLAIRSPRGVTLTEAGRYLALEGKSLVDVADKITKTVDDQELAVARGKQTNIGGWKRPIKRS